MEVIERGSNYDRVRCAHRKVAIVGAASGRAGAPYADPAWCVWALNEIPQARFDRHFEMHPMDKQSERELSVLALMREPCYVLEATPLVPAGVIYPIAAMLLAGYRDYFTCTFAYQVALAAFEGFEEIGLWGVSLYEGTPRERTVERACVEYWLGFAEGRGIRVTEDSGLARQPWRYGYDYDREVRFVRSEVSRLGAVIAAQRAHESLTSAREAGFCDSVEEEELRRLAREFSLLGERLLALQGSASRARFES